MDNSTASRIRRGAELALAEGSCLDGEEEAILARVRALGRGKRARLPERDQLLYRIVLLYRAGPASRWAPVLLEAIAPQLMLRLTRFSPVGPVIGDEDIAQQFLMELLKAALVMPLEGPECLERRLILRAADSVTRWLEREDDYRSLFEDPDEEEHEEDDQNEPEEDPSDGKERRKKKRRRQRLADRIRARWRRRWLKRLQAQRPSLPGAGK